MRRRAGQARWIVASFLAGWAAVAASAAGTAFELLQAPTHYPACTADSLAGFPWTHPAFGKMIPGIALRNMSLATCRVAGFPTVRAYEATGRQANLTIEHKFFADDRIYAYTVAPGGAVFFAFYGSAPRGEYDRTCVGIAQIDVLLPSDRQPIDVTIATGTCGGRMTVSQIFPISELQ